MSRFRVSGAVTVLLIAGYLAAAQTPVTNTFLNAIKLIPEGHPIGASDTHFLTSSSLFNGEQLTGTWAPGNRGADLLFSLDVGTPTLLLSPVGGRDLNDDRPLFLADLDFGEQGTLVKWGVIVTAIPEPSTLALMGLGGITLGLRFMRRRL